VYPFLLRWVKLVKLLKLASYLEIKQTRFGIGVVGNLVTWCISSRCSS
jgi:hypothetical protein